MPEIISRKEAWARGLKRYFTGKACLRGHIAQRLVCDCRCNECKGEDVKEYMRRTKYHLSYYQKWRERKQELARKRRAANPEKWAERAKRWREANPDKVKAYDKKYKAENREKLRACGRKYAASNRDKLNKISRDRIRKARIALAILERAGIHID